MKSRLRLLNRRPAGVMFTRLRLLLRQCRSARKILVSAEKGDSNWIQNRDALDRSCDQLRRMFAELSGQLPVAAASFKDTIQVRTPRPDIAAAALNAKTVDETRTSRMNVQ